MGKLGDYITIKHGFAFKGNSISKEDNGIVLVTPGNFKIGGGFQEDKCKFFHGDYPEEYVLHENDLIVTMTDLSKDGDTLGYGAKIPFSSNRIYLHNQRIGLVRFKDESVDKDFLYWFMRTAYYHKIVLTTSSGSTVKHTSPSRICEIEVNFPALSIQRNIAAILNAIEGKIALNMRINDNLIDLLHTHYQSCFGHSVKDAQLGSLSDICKFSSERIAVSNISIEEYFSTENMLPNKAGVTTATTLPTVSQTTKCKKGDTLISNIRPYFKKIYYCQSDCACSSDVLCFVPRLIVYSAFLFCTLYADRFFDYMVSGSKGTKMPRGDKRQIMAYAIPIPTNDSLASFNESAIPILSKIEQNREENKTLASLRDALLPRLMSGELDVSGLDL